MPYAPPRRSYEFVIEETIPASSPKVQRTSKSRIPRPDTFAAVKDTHEIFQQAVGFWTLVIARLGASRANGGEPANSLWSAHLAGAEPVKTLVKKLRAYPALKLGDSDDSELWLKACFQQAAGKSGLPTEEQLAKTYAWLEDSAVKQKDPTKPKGRKKNLPNQIAPATKKVSDLKSLANTWVGFFCKRNGRADVPGAGPGDQLHRVLNPPTGLPPVWTDVKKFVEQFSLESKPRHLLKIAAKTCITANFSEESCRALLQKAAIRKPRQSLGGLFPWQTERGVPLLPVFFSDAVSNMTEMGKPATWAAFDSAAFKRAAEDVFKFEIRTEQRRALVNKLAAELALMEGKGRAKSEDTERLFGFEGDSRKDRLVDLLKKLSAARGSGEEGYGLRRTTLGGWDLIRERFRSAVAKDRDASKADLIKKVVEKTRDENSAGFGSADFFYELADENFRSIWAEESLSPKDWHSDDVVSDFCTYREKWERLERIAEHDGMRWVPKKINYSLPGTGTAYRPYDFECKELARNPQFSLWYRDNPSSPHARKIETNQGDAFVLSLSGRRMKRDRLMGDNGETYGSAYLPPMAAALVDPDAAIASALADHSKVKDDAKLARLATSLRLVVLKYPSWSALPEPLRRVLIEQLKLSTEIDPSTSTRDAIFQSKNDPVLKALRSPRAERLTLLPPRPGHEQDAFHFSVAFEISQAEQDAIRVPPMPGKAVCRWTQKAGAFMAWPVDLKIDAAEKENHDVGEDAEDDEDAAPSASTLKARDLWCQKATIDSQIFALGVDLGVRATASFMRGEARRFDDDTSISPKWRPLAPKGDVAWAMRFLDRGKMRLPGEDVRVWNKSKGGAFAPQQELYGSRGRPASQEEYRAFHELAANLLPESELKIPSLDSETGRFVPLMADHLVFRLERRLQHARRTFRLRWRAIGRAVVRNGRVLISRERKPEEKIAERRRLLEELFGGKKMAVAGQETDEGWLEPLRAVFGKLPEGESRIAKIDELAQHDQADLWVTVGKVADRILQANVAAVVAPDGLLEGVAMWAWPLRDRRWKWKAYEPVGDVLGSLARTHSPSNETSGTTPRLKIAGQRGLSMARIELLQRLRRCCQSLVKIERRLQRGSAGIDPQLLSDESRDHEPCPAVLEKVDQLREQRVFQTAHMIIAEALGLELANPDDVEIDGLRKRALKTLRDLHGWYRPKIIRVDDQEQKAPRCNVIVLENLSRYRTSSDRSRFENRQLMEWSHRAVTAKVIEMARTFGIQVICVDARFSSRYDALASRPGVRVARIRKGFDLGAPWNRWIAEKNRSDGKPTKSAERLQLLKEQLDASDGKRELLSECDGGPLFMNVDGHVYDADENAAGAILIRAFAHPDLLHFSPAIWAETKADSRRVLLPWRGALAGRNPEERTVSFIDAPVRKPGKREMLFIFGPPGSDNRWLGVTHRSEVKTAGGTFTVAPSSHFWPAVEGAVRQHIRNRNERADDAE